MSLRGPGLPLSGAVGRAKNVCARIFGAVAPWVPGPLSPQSSRPLCKRISFNSRRSCCLVWASFSRRSRFLFTIHRPRPDHG